jgi:dynein intermediate chain 2
MYFEAFFDTRRGSQPVDYSRMDSSHRDIVQDVKWIQSKNSTVCLSVSTDGLIYIWDVRNLQKPVGDYVLENTDQKKGYVGSLGGLCIDYDIQYSVRLTIIVDKL